MNAAWSAALLAAGVLLFAWTYGQCRRPHPKPWTHNETLATTLTLVILMLLAFGLASLVMFLADLASEEQWLLDIAVAAVSFALCWILVPRLMAPALQTAEPAQAAGMPEAANDLHPTPPTKHGGATGRSGRRRAA